MAPKTLALALTLALAAGQSIAECATEGFAQVLPEFDVTAPAPPDPSLRPVVPECLQGLSGPEQENCARDEIAAYGAAVEAWVAALNAYVSDTNQFANDAAVFANAAIDHAQDARTYADGALEFANCEVGLINERAE
jgi:hypothetical protein